MLFMIHHLFKYPTLNQFYFQRIILAHLEHHHLILQATNKMMNCFFIGNLFNAIIK